MKKIIVSFLVTSLSLFGSEPIQVTIKTLQKRGEADNQLYYLPNQDIPFTGKAVAYYRNGRKMTEISYKDGKQDGLKSHWYESGQKWVERNYKDGKMHGPYNWWYESGLKKTEGNFEEGELHEHVIGWYDNGQTRDEAFYIGGFMDSIIVWKPDGEKCPVTNVNAGSGVMLMYHQDGTEFVRLTYKDGKLTRHELMGFRSLDR